VTTRTTGRSISEMAKHEGEFLESVLPLRAFATLTTREHISRNKFDDLLKQWVGGVQEHNRLTIGTVASFEVGVRRHAHVALIAAGRLDCDQAESLWRKLASWQYQRAAIVRPYIQGLCGSGYVVKYLNSPVEEITFSANLAAFAKDSGKSLFRTTSAQRRQFRRIKAQLNKYSNCAVPAIAQHCSPAIPAEWLARDHGK
jgi:hypothetical protein